MKKKSNDIPYIYILIIGLIFLYLNYNKEEKKDDEQIEVPEYIKENNNEEIIENKMPDDYHQRPEQIYKDYANIFDNKITPLNYMYKSNDDIDKKNVYTNQYQFKKYMNVHGIGSGEVQELYAFDEYEQDNYTYIPTGPMLSYEENL